MYNIKGLPLYQQAPSAGTIALLHFYTILHTSCYLNVILTYVFVLETEISTAWISRVKEFQFANYFIDMFICVLSILVFSLH